MYKHVYVHTPDGGHNFQHGRPVVNVQMTDGIFRKQDGVLEVYVDKRAVAAFAPGVWMYWIALRTCRED